MSARQGGPCRNRRCRRGGWGWNYNARSRLPLGFSSALPSGIRYIQTCREALSRPILLYFFFPYALGEHYVYRSRGEGGDGGGIRGGGELVGNATAGDEPDPAEAVRRLSLASIG